MKSYFNSEWGVNSVKLKPFGSLAASDVAVLVERFLLECLTALTLYSLVPFLKNPTKGGL